MTRRRAAPLACAALLLCVRPAGARAPDDGVRLGVRFDAAALAAPVPAIEGRIRRVATIARDPVDWANFRVGAPAELYQATILASLVPPTDRAQLRALAAQARRDPERTLFGLLAGEPAAWDRLLDSIVGENFPLFHQELIWAFAPVVPTLTPSLRARLAARLADLYARAIDIRKTYGEGAKGPRRALDALARIVVAPDEVFARARARGRPVRRAYEEALRQMQAAVLPPEVRRVTLADIEYLASILPAERGPGAPILFGSFVNGQADPRRSDIDVAAPTGPPRALPRTTAAMRARFGGGDVALAVDDAGERLYQKAISGVYNTFYLALDGQRLVLHVTRFVGFALDRAEKPIFATSRHPL